MKYHLLIAFDQINETANPSIICFDHDRSHLEFLQQIAIGISEKYKAANEAADAYIKKWDKENNFKGYDRKNLDQIYVRGKERIRVFSANLSLTEVETKYYPKFRHLSETKYYPKFGHLSCYNFDIVEIDSFEDFIQTLS